MENDAMMPPDCLGRRVQLEGVERQQRQYDHEADHVHEIHGDEYREPAKLSGSDWPRSPAAPPVGAERRKPQR